MDMEIEISKLKNFLTVVCSLTEEVRFNMTTEGIDVKIVDSAHVMMGVVKIAKDEFETYIPKTKTIGISVMKIAEFIKIGKSGDIVGLTYDEDAKKLRIQIGNIKRSLRVLSLRSLKDPKIPTFTLGNSFIIQTEDVARTLKASEPVTAALAFQVNDDGFYIRGHNESDDIDAVFSKDLLMAFEIVAPGESVFSLEYLNVLFKTCPADRVLLRLDQSQPLQAEYKGGGLTFNGFIAPRIDPTEE